MESLYKNTELMLDFLKAPLLNLHFSYYTLMTFLMMLSVILLSMPMTLLSNLSVVMHLIYGNNWRCLLNLNLIYETLVWGRNWFVDLNAGKTQLVLFHQSNIIKIDVEMDGSVLEKKSSFKILVLSFSSKIECGSCIISITKTTS